MSTILRVSTRAELVEAAGNPGAPELVVVSTIDDVPPLRLAPGQCLRGEERAALRFMSVAEGCSCPWITRFPRLL